MTRRSACAALLALLLAAPPSFAQEGVAIVPYEGYQHFLHLLNKAGLKPLPNAAALRNADAQKTLVVVFGKPEGLNRVLDAVRGLRGFLDEGGALLIATDYNDGGRLADLRVAIDGRTVEVRLWEAANPALAYRRQHGWPMVTEAVQGHPLFAQFRPLRLATNQPSFILVPEDSQLRELAWFSAACHLPQGGPRPRKLPFIAGGIAEHGPGRALVVAGRDLFWNGTIGRLDTHNLIFPEKVVQWLGEGRTHAFVVTDDSVAASFDVPLTQLPIPPPSLVSKVLRELEERNVFNHLLLDNVGRWPMLRGLAIAASLALVLFALHRLVRAHHGNEPTPAPTAVKVAEQQSDLPLTSQRHHFQIDEDNCFEAARELARLCFEGAGGAPPAYPPKAQRGGARLQKKADRLWRLAYGARARPVSAAELASLSLDMAEVRKALATGALAAAEPAAAR